MTDQKASLGDFLREIRTRNHWTLSQVSAMTGLAISTLSKVENNQMSLTYDRIVQLAEGLKVDIVELFGTRATEASPSPLGRRTIELPAGLVGDDDGGEGEDALTAAIRELEEEAGYRAATIEVVGEFFSSPGMVTEAFTLFRATGLEQVNTGGGVDGEDITVHRVALDAIEPFIAARRAEGFGIDTRLLLFLGPRLISI